MDFDPGGFPAVNGYLYRKCIELHAEYAGSCRISVICRRSAEIGAPNHFFDLLPFCYVQGRERRLKTRFFFPQEKERFLESKEKGAPKGVRWLQIGIRRPGFTPPTSTSPVHSGLPGWNRGKPWSYPHFFRRLRGLVSGRGGVVWYSLYCGARRPRRAKPRPGDGVGANSICPKRGGRLYSYLALMLARMSLMTSEISGVVFLSFSMRSMEWRTVVWSRFSNSRPISFRDMLVISRMRYMAT